MNLYGDEHGIQQIDSIKEHLVQSAPIAKIGNIQKYFKIQKQIKAALDEAIKLADENKIRLYQMAQSQLASGKTTLGDDAAFNDLVDTVDSINIVATMHAAKPEQAVSNSEPETVTNNQAVYNGLVQLVTTKLAEARTAGNVEAIEAYETAQKQLQIASKHIDHDAVMGNLIERISATHKNITGEELDTEKLKITENVIELAEVIEPVVEEPVIEVEPVINNVDIISEENNEAKIIPMPQDEAQNDKDLKAEPTEYKEDPLNLGPIYNRQLSENDNSRIFLRNTNLGVFDTEVFSVKDKVEGNKIVSANSSFLNYKYGKSYTEDQYGNKTLYSKFSGKNGLIGFQNRADGISYNGADSYQHSYKKTNVLFSAFRKEETLIKNNGNVTGIEYQQDIGFGFLKFYNDKVDGVDRKQAKIGNVFGIAAYNSINTAVSHDTGKMNSKETKLLGGILSFENTAMNDKSGSFRQLSVGILGLKFGLTIDRKNPAFALSASAGQFDLNNKNPLKLNAEQSKHQFTANAEATRGVYGNFITQKNEMTSYDKVHVITSNFKRYGQDLALEKLDNINERDPKIIPMTNTKNTSKMQA